MVEPERYMFFQVQIFTQCGNHIHIKVNQ